MEQDALGLLEEKILRAMDTISQLRREKDAAIVVASEGQGLRERIAQLQSELDGTRAERDALRQDKETVRKRVERLLDQIDKLNAS